ncbi:MAG: D-alanyl-D-alanine carboxypeptidase [Syntrophus sp. SKADARSKE-3]|nr:D-alanyl-D-alanine carboxypeptidase [Syntrophus sp. SKADARSKE-3]
MYRSFHKRFQLLLLIILLAACSGGGGGNGGTSQVDTQLQQALDSAVSDGAPGAAAFVVLPSGRELARASGYASVIPYVPMDPDRIFRIASNTKTFTAAGVMLLRDDRLLPSIDVPIRNYVPELRIPRDDVITIRMLLGHTSGMADHENDPTPFQDLSAKDRFRVWKPEELVPFAIGYQLAHPEIFNYAPGTQYRYSNTGYVVLAMIIERVTGKSYRDYITSRILVPFGLTHTYTANGRYIPDPYAHGYAVNGDGTLEDWSEIDESWDLGAGGMMSTVRDLARWMTLLVGGSVVSAESLKEMMTKGPNGSYGLGMAYTTGLGWGHGGATSGYRSAVYYDPETRFACSGFTTAEPPSKPMNTLLIGLQSLKRDFVY